MKITRDFIYFEEENQEVAHEKLNAVWNEKQKCWRVTNTMASLQELYSYYKNKDLVENWRSKNLQRKKFIELKNNEDAPGDERLRPYQRVDVRYLGMFPHSGIFNQMRTGKTPTSLVLLKEQEWKRNLIVCPASLCLQWRDEFVKWVGHGKVKVMAGIPKKQREDMFNAFPYWEEMTLITSYETLLRDRAEYMQQTFDCMILDEAHRLRSITKGMKGRSQQSKVCMSVGRRAEHRLALTGTPTVSKGEEIYGILSFLYPERFPGRWQFNERYFHVQEDFMGVMRVGKYKRQAELEEILTLVSVNRKQKEVMSWLPKKQYQRIKLQPTTKQAKAYKDVSELFEYEENGELKVDAQGVLDQLIRMRQITTGPKMLDIDDDGAKEKFIMEWLEDNPNEPVVIFSTFTSYLHVLFQKLREKKYKVGLMVGDIPQTVRKTTAKQFQDGGLHVLLCNIKANKEGITLDRGRTVIFLDKEYNPADNDQATERITPISEERNHSISVISLALKDTFDETLEWLLKNKIDITSVVNDAGINGLKRLLDSVE